MRICICFSREDIPLPAAHREEVTYLSSTAMWINTWPINPRKRRVVYHGRFFSINSETIFSYFSGFVL